MSSKVHIAYDSIQLKLPVNKVQIECLASYDDKLLIVTKQGQLMVHKVTQKLGELKYDAELVQFVKNFSKKPVTQVAAVPEFDILIKLSDNIVVVHEMSSGNFTQICSLSRSKGATLFTMDVQKIASLTGDVVAVRMCVAVKKKLQFYFWKLNEFRDFAEDVNIPDTPLSMAWSQQNICLGFKSYYYLVVELGEKGIDLFPVDKNPEPCVVKVGNGLFALGKDNQCIIIDANSSEPSTLIKTVRWSDIPLTVFYNEPYFLSLMKDTVEVRCWDIEPKVEVKSLQISGATTYSVSRQGFLYIASAENIWLVHGIPVHKQIKYLLQDKKFELAIKLANIAEGSEDEKKNNVNQIQTLYAFDLFHNKKFSKSMDEFLKLNIDPYEVIRLFPNLIPSQARDPNVSEVVEKLEDHELESVLLALIQYLTAVRLKLIGGDSRSSQQLMQIIDTTLLKCYLQTNDAMVAPIIRRENCHFEETEYSLKQYKKFSELIILYETKGMHKMALELLKEHREIADSPIRDHDRTIKYLQKLGNEHINLIFEYAGWVLEAHPEDGLKIFIDDSPEVEQLPRHVVLDYLIRIGNHQLTIAYLEHVVHIWKETNSVFHDDLIHEYRELIAIKGEENAKDIKEKLLEFLNTSKSYSPEVVLIRFPNDSLFEERAIINGKLGRHEHTLGIYICVLDDYKKALEYCEKVWNSTGDGRVYVCLLRLLISPPDSLPGVKLKPGKTPPAPDLETALALLDGSPTRLPPLEVIQELPPSVPVSRIHGFLTATFQEVLNKRRRGQLLYGLLKAKNLQVLQQKTQLESKHFLITETTVCTVCKKRFGNQSAFVHCPNGDIIHYSCQERL